VRCGVATAVRETVLPVAGSWPNGIPPSCLHPEHEPDESLGLLADDAVDLA